MTLISSFLNTYLEIFAAVFSLGVSYYVSPNLSTAAFAFSTICLLLFIVFGNVAFIFLSVVSVALGYVVKNMGI